MSNPPSNYWLLIRQRFLKNSRAKWSVRALLLLMGIAILGDFIAGEIPIYCKYENQAYFPVFKKQAVDWGISHWQKPFQNVNWKELSYQQVIYPLIPYSGSRMDINNSNYKSPFDQQQISSWRYRHWLGTDDLGRDVAAGLIEGLRIALKVGLLSMLLASFIGILLGGLAGYFGDESFLLSRGRLFLNIIALFCSIHLGFIARSYPLTEGVFFWEVLKSLGIVLIIFLTANFLARWIERLPFLSKPVALPIDLMVMRLIEVLNAIPGLLLILAIAAVIQTETFYTLIFIIGILYWTGIARFIRAELLKVRSMDYIQSTKAVSYTHLTLPTKRIV